MPQRIQRRRAQGWRMPENAVYVGRPSKWGNRFIVDTADQQRLAHYADFYRNVDLWDGWPVPDAETAVRAFREMQCASLSFDEEVRQELRGKDLVCWCALDKPCHADVLLDMANREDDL